MASSTPNLQAILNKPIGDFLMFRNSGQESRLIKKLCELISEPTLSANDRHKACHYLRCLLQTGPFPPFHEVIAIGFVPNLIQLLSEHHVKIKAEALFMMNLFAQSEHTDAIVDAGAVVEITNLVDTTNESLCILAIDTLGLILQRHPELRGIRDGLWDPTLTLSTGFIGGATESLLLSRAMTNFLSYPFNLTQEMAGRILETIKIFLQSENLPLIASQLHNFSLLSQYEIGNANLQTLTSVCAKIVELLRHDSSQVLIPALNSVTGIFDDDSVERNALVRSFLFEGMLEEVTVDRMLFIISGEYGKGIKQSACYIFKFLAKMSNEIQLQALIRSGAVNVLVGMYRLSDNQIREQVACFMLSVALLVMSNSLPGLC